MHLTVDFLVRFFDQTSPVSSGFAFIQAIIWSNQQSAFCDIVRYCLLVEAYCKTEDSPILENGKFTITRNGSMFNSTEYIFLHSTALYECNYGYQMKTSASPYTLLNSTVYTCVEGITESNQPTEPPKWTGVVVNCHGRF